MSNEKKHTQGKVVVTIQKLWEEDGIDSHLIKVNRERSPEIGYLFDVAIVCECGRLTDEKIANANLIADCFNVTNESGLTPSEVWEVLKEVRNQFDQLGDAAEKLQKENAELLEQRKELLEALEKSVNYMDAWGVRGEDPLVGNKLTEDFLFVKQAILKAKGKQ